MVQSCLVQIYFVMSGSCRWILCREVLLIVMTGFQCEFFVRTHSFFALLSPFGVWLFKLVQYTRVSLLPLWARPQTIRELAIFLVGDVDMRTSLEFAVGVAFFLNCGWILRHTDSSISLESAVSGVLNHAWLCQRKNVQLSWLFKLVFMSSMMQDTENFQSRCHTRFHLIGCISSAHSLYVAEVGSSKPSFYPSLHIVGDLVHNVCWFVRCRYYLPAW